MHGPLYYRELEKNNTQALKVAKGNFDTTMVLSQGAKAELHWWESNVETTFQTLSCDEPQHIITTDASLSGWGAEYQGISTGGMWTDSEAKNHNNYLEMLATHLALLTFAKNMNSTHIQGRIQPDRMNPANAISFDLASQFYSKNWQPKRVKI